MIDGRRPADHVERIRAVTMQLRDLFRDPKDGTMSVVKSVSITAAVALTTGFLLQSKFRDLEWMDYIGYALAMAMSATPTLASSGLGIMAPRLSGLAMQPPAPIQPSADVAVTTTVTTNPSPQSAPAPSAATAPPKE